MDSMRSVLMSPKIKAMHDTVKCRLMIDLSWKLVYSNPDSAIRLTTRAKELMLKTDHKTLLGACYHALGWFYDVKAAYNKSLENYEMAMAIWNEYDRTFNKAATLGNMGSVYGNMGDFPKALDYYLRSQLICEQLGLKDEIAIGNNNIGIIYLEKNDNEKALTYFFKALKVFREIKHQQGMQSALSNIGNAYSNLKDQKKALVYLEEALQITEKTGDKIGSSTNLGSIGLAYHYSDPGKALLYYEKALSIALETGDKGNIANWQGNIGELYLNKKDYAQSGKFLSSALSIFKESNDMEGQMQSNRQLSELYNKMGKSELALKHFRRYCAIKDTLFNSEKEKAITFREMNYEFDKKQSVIKSIHDKVMLEAETQKKKQKLILWLACIGVVLVILFFVFIFRSLQIARKQKDIISAQKHLVDEKQREVLDSIHYAKRIQTALMPSEWYFDKNLRSLKN
jgi:tetratricopeptide (TPR) repeat protein